MLTKFTTAKFVEEFLQSIMTDAGMDSLPENVKDQMLSDLYARLEDWIFGYIVRGLSEEDLTIYRQLLESKAEQEKLDNFLEEKMPNAQEVFAQALLDFRTSYLGLNE